MGFSALALGGIFLLFLFWKLSAFDEHSKAFLEGCQIASESLNASGKSDFCTSVHLGLFRTKAPYMELSYEQLKLPDLPIDRNIRIVIFQNPKFFSSLSFCKSESFRDSEAEGKSFSDFSLSQYSEEFTRDDIKTLSVWLKTAKGKDCLKTLERESPGHVPDLSALLGQASRLVLLNPVAWLREKLSLASLYSRFGKRVNQARIRELYIRCSDLEEWAGYEWQDLKRSERQALQKSNPDIDWLDPNTAALELLLLRYAEKPIELRNYAKQCDLI